MFLLDERVKPNIYFFDKRKTLQDFDLECFFRINSPASALFQDD